MNRVILLLVFSGLGLGPGAAGLAVSAGAQDGARATAATCQTTPVVIADPVARLGQLRLPHDRWYVNREETLWAGWDATRLRSGARNQVVWIGPTDHLTIAARRLDGDATPIRTSVAPGDGWLVVSELHFSDAGCWEVTAASGERELRFVTVIEPVPPPGPLIAR